MLEIGNGMTAVEDRTEMTLWAALAAPLIAGTDLVHATPATLALLTNRAVVAVDQDPLGRPARQVTGDHGLDVLTRPLSGGDVAVVLFNETSQAATMTTNAAAVGAPGGRDELVDLWSGTVTTTDGTIQATVPPHGSVLYRITSAPNR
jgi:alpha-galactosidase